MNEEQQIYMEQLMDNYKNPQNVGVIEDYTYFSNFKNPTCGDKFEIYIKLDNKNKKIENVKFKGDGCAISTASMSLFSQKLIGMNLEDAKKLTNLDVFKILGVKISPGRINCAMISINAFNSAIKNN